jgi:hypothetical protein
VPIPANNGFIASGELNLDLSALGQELRIGEVLAHQLVQGHGLPPHRDLSSVSLRQQSQGIDNF